MGNLRPFTHDNAAHFGRLGGIASGKARRAKREKNTREPSLLPELRYFGRDKDCTWRQHIFILEYMVTCNAAEAARRAGYSVRSAKECGYRLLHDAKVQRVWAAMLERMGVQ